MSTKPRLDEPGALHHVWARGVARSDIYLDDLDRRRFLAIVGVVMREARCRCLAWALMDNHYHFVVETGAVPLSRVFHRINHRYARSFNVRHGRVGHLFQGRFGSARVGDDRYLAELIAYVHLNPVRCGIVASPDDLAIYPWTGYPALTGRTPRRFHDVDRALAAFGDRRGVARHGLRKWMEHVHARTATHPVRPPTIYTHLGIQARDRVYGTQCIRGRSRFLDRVVRELESRAVRHQRHRSRGWTVESIVTRVAERVGANLVEVATGRRTSAETKARAIAAFVARECIGAGLVETARIVGVGAPAVSQCIERGRRLVGAMRCEAEEFLKK